MGPPCLTCRARKKACDRGKPQCRTCVRANRHCGGYIQRENTVFVNLNYHSIAKPLKPIIGKAISASKHAHIPGRCRDNDEYAVSLRILDLSSADFQDHFTTLWASFHDKYARSPNSWSAGATQLGLQDRALDLAMISLATMRLSISENSNIYRVFSLSAYSTSLTIFRRLLQSGMTGRVPCLSVVTSLIFTLIEGAQQIPTNIFDSGWAGHLKGTLALMQNQRPESFRATGLLSVFRRVREMAIHFALSNRETTFLARPEWKSLPWDGLAKTPRDRLHDIAVDLTAVYTILPQLSSPERSHESGTSKAEDLCCRLHAQLMAWQASYLKVDIFNLAANAFPVSLDKDIDTLYQLQVDISREDFAFLTAEFIALLLLLKLAESKLVQNAYKLPLDEPEAGKVEKLSYDIKLLEKRLREILCLPCFGQAAAELPGLTEGRCRSLLPTWALAQSTQIAADNQVQYWDTLALRLIYGIG